MDIAKIDKNFKIETNIEREGLCFYKLTECDALSLHGVFFEKGCFRRMPEDKANAVSEAVGLIHKRTTGGRIRFITDSPYVAISAKLAEISRFSHMALAGSAGFDIYLDGLYHATFMPPYTMTDGFEAVCNLPKGEHSVVINMPLYSNVCELYIGVKEDSLLLPPEPYRIEKPIVYYGSSITHGACASRPGNSYPNIISRVLSAEQINLGFSGNAKGEPAMAEYIADIPMSAFVYDYDFNAPTEEHLRNTHYPFYKIIRDKNPTLPIIMMSRPLAHVAAWQQKRIDVIRESYERGLAEGDKNLYMLSGAELISPEAAECFLVDGVHPTDAGFVCMAEQLLKLLKTLL